MTVLSEDKKGRRVIARTQSGWLTVDGERMFKIQGETDAYHAARDVARGAMVGAMRWYYDDAFSWDAPPTLLQPHLGRDDIATWLETYVQEKVAAFANGTALMWNRMKASDGQIALVLLPEPC